MKIKRVIEIVDSLGVIEVNYKGNPVWIENINHQSNTVKVKDINTNKELNANISDLEEN